MVINYYNLHMKSISTILFLLSYFNLYSQVITIEYLEEVIFAIEKDRGLIEQWENDDIIWGDALGFKEGEGIIRYVFDFNNMTVELGFYKSDGEVDLYGKWDIKYIISDWDASDSTFACVGDTEHGDYFYNLNSTVKGTPLLFRYYHNRDKKDTWALPSLNWDKYGIAVGNVDSPTIVVIDD